MGSTRIKAFAFVAASLAAALSAGVATAEPLKLRIHWATIPGHWAPMDAKVGAAAQPHYGKSYVVEPIFIAKNRSAPVDFPEDNIRLRRWAAGPGDAQAVKHLAELVKKPVAEMDDAYTKGDNYYDPDAKANAERMQKNIDDLVKIKLVDATINAKTVIDNLLAEEAAKRVGPLTN